MVTSRHKLTVVCGNAGAGKTTWGKALAKERSALLLDIDTVSERLVQAGQRAAGRNPNDRDSPEYKSTFREAIHDTLFAIADDNLETVDCVVVAPFTQERRQADFPQSLEKRLGCDVEVIFVWCDESTRRARIERRGNPRDTAKLSRWESYANSGRDPEPRPPFAHSFIDTSKG